jgi:hypothetical protein
VNLDDNSDNNFDTENDNCDCTGDNVVEFWC